MGVYVMHVNMMRGEVTPLLHGRVDSELYQAGLHEAQNVVSTRYGAVTRAPGLLNHGALKVGSEATYMVPFIFNRQQVYVLEFSSGYVRFWTPTGQVFDGGSPYEVVSPFTTDHLPTMHWWQSGDVLYMTADGVRPKKLIRSSETSWAFEDYDPKDGPYFEVNKTATVLTPSARADASERSGDGRISTSQTALGAANSGNFAFDGNPATTATADNRQGNLAYVASVAFAADAYWLQADDKRPARMPVKWRFEGSNNLSTWTTLDAQSGENGWSAGEVRHYEFPNDDGVQFKAYRLVWDGTDDPDNDATWICELGIHVHPNDQGTITLTASSIVGVNDGAGFQSTDVGRMIRLYGGDGKWRWAKITTYVSTTVVRVTIHGHSFPNTSGVLLWRMGAWSDYSGWPKVVGSYENRVGFANTDSEPFSVWLTKSAGYENMSISDPLVDDDAVSARPNPTGKGLDPVLWLLGDTDFLMGTEGALKALGPRDASKAFSPNNVRQLGAENTPTFNRPGLSIGSVTIFFDDLGRAMYEAAYSNEADSYVAKEATVLNEHLFLKGITRYAFQRAPHRVVWCVTTGGDLLAVTYDRDQKVFGVTRRPVDGLVDDIITLPGSNMNEDYLFVTVRRESAPGSGYDTGYLERLAPYYRSDLHDYPVYFDRAAVAEPVASSSVAVGTELAGFTVGVWLNGLDIGDMVVTGAGNLEFAEPVTGTLVCGLRNAVRLKTLKLVQWGQKDGGGPGRQVRVVDGYVSLYECGPFDIGTDAEMDSFKPDGYTPDPDTAPALRTGDFHIGAVDDRWKDGGQLTIETDRAYPLTVRSITVHADGTP